ncbi:MAG: molecular chaperone HtpG [Chloroflexota bacterium]
MSETYAFKAEIQQLLDILVHSLYTDREIFLRELVSNASDALNRMQFEMVQNRDVLDADAELKVEIHANEDANTLTISDTGIGMNRDDLVNNIGTIARSGAKGFMEALKDKPDGTPIQDVIGQFGVGFYSVFMVADKVRVVSRSHEVDGQAWAWESDGGNEFIIEEADKATRGTDIIVFLKDEASEFASAWKARDIVKRHSDYVAFPIYVPTAADLADPEPDEDGNVPEKAPLKPANSQKAIWRRAKSEIEDEDYNNFYRQMTMDFQEPIKRIHMKADLPLQFYALLYIPATSEKPMFSPRKEPGLKLYARKVLIQEYNKDLLPEYLLQVVQGVVDSEDLPLNVSRETVKADAIIAKLRSTLTNKVLSELGRMASKRPDEYLDIFAAHGRWFKQGITVEPDDKKQLMPLLFFPTTRSENEDEMFSLADYVENMTEGQDDIYFIVGDDYHSAARSPHLDAFKQRGIEVLFFTDPVDPIMVMGLDEFEGKTFRSVDDANIDLSEVGELQESEDDEDTREAVPEADFNDVVDRFKEILGERVTGVQVGKNLVSSPARLVTTGEGKQAVNSHMFRVNRLFEREYDLPVKTLELNPRHPLLHNLTGMLRDDSKTGLVNSVVEQVFETALLQDGIHPDPASMADRLYALLQAATEGNAAGGIAEAEVMDE